MQISLMSQKIYELQILQATINLIYMLRFKNRVDGLSLFVNNFKTFWNMVKHATNISLRWCSTSSCIFNPNFWITDTNKLQPKQDLDSGASTILLTNIRIRVPPLIVASFTISYQSINCVRVFLQIHHRNKIKQNISRLSNNKRNRVRVTKMCCQLPIFE